jgi:hypothetical protein
MKPALQLAKPLVRHKHIVRKISLVVVGLILVSSSSWLYIKQRSDLTAINKRVSQLTVAKSSALKQDSNLATENSKLTSDNANLNKAVKLLQAQIAQVAPSAPTEQTTPPPASSSLEITSATNTSISTYPPPAGSSWATSIPAIAVHVTIHNQTSADQSYGENQFGAVTDSGVVVGTFEWTPNISQTAWISTTIVPGASLSETVYFSTGQNLSMLTWQPPGQSSLVELPFPTVN